MQRLLSITLGLLLCGCATSTTKPKFVIGKTTTTQVIARHGEPSMRWREGDTEYMAYYGFFRNNGEGFTASFDARGRLRNYTSE